MNAISKYIVATRGPRGDFGAGHIPIPLQIFVTKLFRLLFTVVFFIK